MARQFFKSGYRVNSAIWLVLLVFGLCGNAAADNTLDVWREAVTTARKMAENDAPAANKEVLRLQASIPAEATPADRVRILNALTRTEIYLAKPDIAAQHAQQAFDQAKQHGDRVGQAEADLNMALNSVNRGKIEAMHHAIIHSMEILQGVDRTDLLVEAMLRTSMMYRRLERFDESVALAVQTLEIAKHSQDPLDLAHAYFGMAVSYDLSGRFPEARKYYTLMLPAARAAHNRLLEADALIGIGNALQGMGDVAAGGTMISQGVRIFETTGMPFYLGRAKYSYAYSLRLQKHFPEAIRQLDEVANIYESRTNRIGLWWTLNARSEIFQAMGNDAAALRDAERTRMLAREIGFPVYLSKSAQRLAALAAAEGDHKRAYALSIEAAEMLTKANNEKVAVQVIELAKHYEEKSRQQQVDELKRRNVLQTAELASRRLESRWLYTLAIGGGLFTLMIGLFLMRLRRSHRLLEQAHTKLIQSEGDLQAILNAVPDMLFEIGLDGRYYSCHSLNPDLLAAPAEVLIGKTVADVMPHDAAENCMSALREAHEQGISTGRQICLPLPQGVCWFELSVARKVAIDGEESRLVVLSRDITERVALENDLKVREQYQRALLDNFPFMVWLKDQDSRLLAVNRAYLAAAGLPSDAPYFGKTDLDLFPADLAEQYRADDREVMQNRQRKTVEELVGQPGNLRWHETGKMPVWDDAGELLGTVGYARDITESRQYEASLRASEQQFRTLSENTPSAIVRYDLDCRRVYFNQAYLQVSGNQADQCLGKTPMEHWGRALLSPLEFTAMLRQVIASGEPQTTTFEVPEPSGEMTFRTMNLVPEFDESRKVASVLCFSHDITDIKRMEAMLRKREMEFRTLAENSPEMIMRYDRDYRRVYVNPAYERYTGNVPEEVLSKTPGQFWKPIISRDVYVAWLQRVMKTGVPEKLFLEWALPEGGRTSHLFHAVAEHNEHGDVVGALVIGHNISELKATERHLQESRAELRAMTVHREASVEEERKRIAREIHDELGQLLNVLRLNVSTLDYRFGDGNPDLHDKASKMVGVVDSAIHMVRSLATRLHPAALNAGLVPALEWMVQDFSENTDIVCELDIEDEEIHLDEDRAMVVFRIVQESLTNVLRHSGADFVEISLRLVDKQCEVIITDNGQGFDMAHPGRPNSLGIVGMRERALMLSGDLVISSEPGAGTTLRLCLPIEESWARA